MATCGQRAASMAAGVAIVLSIGGVRAREKSATELGAAVAPALRAQGLELGYNLDHAEALAAFKKAIAADPGDPAAYRLAAATAWIDMLFRQGAITVDDSLGQARANLPREAPAAEFDAAFHDTLRQALILSEERLRNHPS